MLSLLLNGSLVLLFSFINLAPRAFHQLLIWPQISFLGLHVHKLQMWTPTDPPPTPFSIFSPDFQPTAGKRAQQESIEQVPFMSHRYEYHFSQFKNLQAYLLLQLPVEKLPIDFKKKNSLWCEPQR